MTAARLSPSATLLRNSKLFALPPAIPLPPARPSSEPVSFSDTATTPWPVLAAIETPLLSRNKGDWGLKRPLPLKSTTKSGTPVIRIRRGIDTGERIVDFESAADHVLTIQKWQTLNLPMTLPRWSAKDNDDRQGQATSVFSSNVDNTNDASAATTENDRPTGLWPDIDQSELDIQLPAAIRESNRKATEARAASKEGDRRHILAQSGSQKTKRYRWRYAGPWLAGMTAMEFGTYIEKVVSGRRKEFRQKVKAHMAQEIEAKKRESAQAEGIHRAASTPSNSSQISPSEEDITNYIKGLRSDPSRFGRLITEFLDLPEGPRDGSSPVQFDNGRLTAASAIYAEYGPPRSHPSAGLSYIRTRTFSGNDPLSGPQDFHMPAVGRVLKTKRAGTADSPTIGLGGFVVSGSTTRGDIRGRENIKDRKVTLVAQRASVNPAGGIDIIAENSVHFQAAKDNMPIRNDLAASATPTPPRAAIDARNSNLFNQTLVQPSRAKFTQTRSDLEKMRLESEAQQGAPARQLLNEMQDHFRPKSLG